MAKTDTDRELVARARAGDVTAFGQLVRRYQDLASAIALNTLGPSADVDDVIQDAFLDAFRGLGTYDSERPFGRWLRTIVRNRCRRELRRRTRQPQALSAADEPVAERDGARNLAADVMEEVDHLRPARREAPLLYYIDGYSMKEVAAFTGKPLGTVKRLMHEARNELKKGHDAMVREAIRRKRPGRGFTRRTLQALLRRGMKLRDAGRTDEAAAAFTRALELDPSFAGALVERGWMTFDQARRGDKRKRAAISDLRGALKRDLESWYAAWSLALAYATEGRWERAEEVYSRALLKWPEKEADILGEKLYAMHCARPFKEVSAFYRRIAKKFPDHPRITYFMGWAAYQAGKLKQAIRLLEGAARLDPVDNTALNNLATIYWDKYNDTEKAVRYMRQAARVRVHWMDLLNLIWMCRVAWEKRPDRRDWARESLRAAADFLVSCVLADDVRGWRALSQVLAAAQNEKLTPQAKTYWLSQARRIFRRALANHPRRPWLKLVLAEVELHRGDENAARALIKKLLRSKSGRTVLASYDTRATLSSCLPEALGDKVRALQRRGT